MFPPFTISYRLTPMIYPLCNPFRKQPAATFLNDNSVYYSSTTHVENPLIFAGEMQKKRQKNHSFDKAAYIIVKYVIRNL